MSKQQIITAIQGSVDQIRGELLKVETELSNLQGLDCTDPTPPGQYAHPTDMNLVCYINGEDVTLSSNDVIGLTDQTGNGNDFTTNLNPQFVANGINGQPCVELLGGDRILNLNTFSNIGDLSKRAGWIVFQLTDINGFGNYHNILIFTNSVTGLPSNAWMNLWNPNDSNDFNINYNGSSLDDTYAQDQLTPHYLLFKKDTNTSSLSIDGFDFIDRQGSQDLTKGGIIIGTWNGRGMKGYFAEMGLFNHDTDQMTQLEIDFIKQWVKDRYNIGMGVNVTNSGIGGDNTNKIIDRLPALANVRSDLTILMIGTNDWEQDDPTLRNTPEDYKTNLTTIVQNLKSYSDVLILPPPPVVSEERQTTCSVYGQSTPCDVNATGQVFRDKVLEVATEESIYYLDIYQEFVNISQPTNDSSSYMINQANSGQPDGRHPTATGAEFIAQKVVDFLVANTLSYANINCVGDSITEGHDLLGEGSALGETIPAKLKDLLNV